MEAAGTSLGLCTHPHIPSTYLTPNTADGGGRGQSQALCPLAASPGPN